VEAEEILEGTSAEIQSWLSRSIHENAVHAVLAQRRIILDDDAPEAPRTRAIADAINSARASIKEVQMPEEHVMTEWLKIIAARVDSKTFDLLSSDFEKWLSDFSSSSDKSPGPGRRRAK
jgi:hypothetical protein